MLREPPERETSLVEQITEAGVRLRRKPQQGAPFPTWKRYWQRQGVFTVANQFGGIKSDKDKGGEVEAFLERIDSNVWHEAYSRYAKSKVRAGYAFAEEVDLRAHPGQLRELQGMWDGVLNHLRIASR